MDKTVEILKLINELLQIKISLPVFITCTAMLFLEYYKLITLDYNWHTLVLIIGLLSLFLSLILLLITIVKNIKKNVSIKKCRIMKLNEIFYGRGKQIYKFFSNKKFIALLYNSNQKQFTVDSIRFNEPINEDLKKQIKNCLEDLRANSYPGLEDKIIDIKDGQYKFYDCVWKELGKYDRQGVIETAIKEF